MGGGGHARASAPLAPAPHARGHTSVPTTNTGRTLGSAPQHLVPPRAPPTPAVVRRLPRGCAHTALVGARGYRRCAPHQCSLRWCSRTRPHPCARRASDAPPLPGSVLAAVLAPLAPRLRSRPAGLRTPFEARCPPSQPRARARPPHARSRGPPPPRALVLRDAPHTTPLPTHCAARARRVTARGAHAQTRLRW